MPRNFSQRPQPFRFSQPSPALAEDEKGYQANPERLHLERETNKAEGSRDTDNHGCGQTMGAAKRKPEESTENLPAIEGIDGE